MEALRCPPGDTPFECSPAASGAAWRCAGCCCTEPDILLLDEPTNHLDAESVRWLERHLQQYKGTVIAVTHDRYFLDNVAEWILELDRGHGIPWKGNYSSWLEQKQERLRQEEKARRSAQKTLERELEWIRMSPKARQAKGKARVTAYETAAEPGDGEAPRGACRSTSRPGRGWATWSSRLDEVSQGLRRPAAVRESQPVSVPPGAIVGVIGPNGAGKTTLLRMITGQEKPDAGDDHGSARRSSWATWTRAATR